MTADDAETAMWEENFELLSELEEHPLNHATREELDWYSTSTLAMTRWPHAQLQHVKKPILGQR